jgi:hypothetical protein
MPRLIKTLGAVLCLVFALSFAAPNAHADGFTPLFTDFGCTGPCPLPTAPNVEFPSPTTMTVTFFGFGEVVVTIPSGDSPSHFYSWEWEVSGPPGSVFQSFLLRDVSTGGGTCQENGHAPGCMFTCRGDPDQLGCGALTFEPGTAATPEPGSLALMLSGVGLVFAMRKRKGLSQAN